MSKRKPIRPEVLTLDADGWGLSPVEVTEALEKGTPEDMRRTFGYMGAMLAGDCYVHMFKSEREWLGYALMRIAAGEDANTVLRLKGRKNAVFRSFREERLLQYQYDQLLEQGASAAEAVRFIAHYRCCVRNQQRQPSEEEIDAERERLKKHLSGRGKGKK